MFSYDMKIVIKFLICLLPWRSKRFFLERIFGYKIHPSARIGLSWIYPRDLIMLEGSRIGSLNVAVHLEEMVLEKFSKIGRSNWITGFPINKDSVHFSHQSDRVSKLILGEHSAITKNHHLDCTNILSIGKFTTIAGYQSQFLTHSINIVDGRQDSMPIEIGEFCFVGTNVVVLGGSSLPNYSVLGAKSLLNRKWKECYFLYGGVPATPKKEIPKDARYFSRQKGFVP